MSTEHLVEAVHRQGMRFECTAGTQTGTGDGARSDSRHHQLSDRAGDVSFLTRSGSAVRIVDASAADLAAVLAVERLAFGADDVADLVRALVDDPSAAPVLSLLAMDLDRAVGHIMFTTARLQGAADDVTVSILAPLAVVPDVQRTGVGGRLIERGVRRLGESGVDLVFVLGHPGYYPRHRFEPAGRLGLAAPYPVSPEEAWMVRALRPGLIGRVQGVVQCAEALDRPEHWRE